MKHTAAFVFFLTVILFAGLFSVDIASALFREKDTFSVQQRSSDTLIGESAGRDNSFGFDPMSLVRGKESSPADGEYLAAAVASAAIMKNMSRSYIDWEFRDDTAYALLDQIRISDTGYVYAERFAYTSKRGNMQFLDFMMNVTNLRIVYMRFYSAADNDVDESSVKNATSQLRSMTDKFYTSYSVSDYYDAVSDQLFNGDPFADSDLQMDDPSDFASADSAYSAAYDLGTAAAKNCDYDELGYFWARATTMSWTYTTSEEYESFFSETTNYIMTAITEDGMDECTYTVYKGRIYQSIDFGPNRLFVIYNITDARPEGFFAKPSL